MLRSAGHLVGYGIRATDGDIGSLDDFLFDDKAWTVRYLVVDTGDWLPGKLVLISPASVGSLPSGSDQIPVSLTRSQIENSPPIDKDMPVSRHKEIELSKYYRWPPYWDSGGLGGAGSFWPIPPVPPGPAHIANEPQAAVAEGDPNLRSTGDVAGYTLRANDGDIGHIEDFIFDEEAWIIRYVVADTRNWILGRKVLIAPQWIERISWEEWAVHVNLSRESIRKSPEYDPSAPISREYEDRLYDYYGRSKYWQDAKK
jgi:uncharacterized protein YrrD